MTTLLWDEDQYEGLVVEPADRLDETLATIAFLKQVATLGELRSRDLPKWAAGLVTSTEERLRVDDIEATEDVEVTWQDLAESVLDVVPVPWDAASVTDWLDEELLAAHAHVSGATPVNIDGYDVADRDAFLAALRERGFELQHRPGLVQEYHRAL